MSVSTASTVLKILSDVTGIDELSQNLDTELYDLHILDSLKTVELMLALSDGLGIDIEPTDFERSEWSTPRRMVAYFERRFDT